MDFTKGEWKVGKSYDSGMAIPIYTDTDEVRDYEMATVHIYNGEQIANVHLIASAPDMYEALKEAEKTLRRNGIVPVLVALPHKWDLPQKWAICLKSPGGA